MSDIKHNRCISKPSACISTHMVWPRMTARRRLSLWSIWRRMEKISWLDKVTNKEVLRRVNKDSQILNSIWQRKHRWIDHILRHDWLLHEITEWKVNQQEGEEKFKCYTIWANDGGFVVLKRAAEDREGWRHRERTSKTCCTAEDYWWWMMCICYTHLECVTMSVRAPPWRYSITTHSSSPTRKLSYMSTMFRWW